MVTQLAKFICTATFVGVLSAIGVLGSDPAIRGAAFGFVLFLGAPVFILVWIDTGKALRTAGRSSRPLNLWGRIFGYPQAVFGFVCTVLGVFIVPYLLYRWWALGLQPQGPWLMAPAGFLAFGMILMRGALKPPQESEDHGESEHGA